jgi:rhodanese-related sulfurtransferase
MKSVLAHQLKKQLGEGKKPTLIDVREHWEYKEERICDCINIPLHDLPFRIHEIENMKQAEIIVYCRSGKRGSQARKYLTLNGFTDVANLEGGMESFRSLMVEA